MAHVFISYSTKDSVTAQFLFEALEVAGASAFLAELSLKPGEKWKDTIIENLRQSQWVFFLATENSCKSQAVAHEIGASLALNKKFIPILFGVTPKDLPEWVDDTQAIDLKESEKVHELIEEIGEGIKSDKFMMGIIVGVLVMGAIWYFSKK